MIKYDYRTNLIKKKLKSKTILTKKKQSDIVPKIVIPHTNCNLWNTVGTSILLQGLRTCDLEAFTPPRGKVGARRGGGGWVCKGMNAVTSRGQRTAEVGHGIARSDLVTVFKRFPAYLLRSNNVECRTYDEIVLKQFKNIYLCI